MNTNSKRLSIYIVLMLIGTAIAVTLRSIACISSLDSNTGYFESGSLTSISDPLIWLTAIGSLTYIFVASRVQLRASFSTAATYIPTGILGVATLFLGARVLTYAVNSSSRYPLLSREVLTSPTFGLSILAFALAMISLGYYFFNTYSTESKVEVRAFFAVAAIAFFAIYAILIYFDQSLPINNPGKIVNQMAYLFSAMFFLYETRISLGREMWRAYTAFGLAAAALTAYSSIPALIAYYTKGTVIFGSHAGAFISIEEYMLTFALFIFILSKLILTVNLKEEKENEYIKAMASFASQRSTEVEDSLERFQEIFAAKQLSIFELYGVDDSALEEESVSEKEEAETKEEEPEVIMLSDDVIYESIFGRMPSKEESEEAPEEVGEAVSEESPTVKDPDEVIKNLMDAIEQAEKEHKDKK